jgi:hypothetical protein
MITTSGVVHAIAPALPILAKPRFVAMPRAPA